MATLLLGAPLASTIENDVRARAALAAERGFKPYLVAVSASDDPANEVYLKRQAKAADRLGFRYEIRNIGGTAAESDVLAAIARLNADPEVTGIIVQMPLPPGVVVANVQRAIAPMKDVEGVHPLNLGELLDGDAVLRPCTAAAILEVAKASGVQLAGRHAVVIGRSRIVGRPAALMFLAESCTVTVCHSRTPDIGALTRTADIVVCAVGKVGLLQPEMVKAGALVLDVGINEVERDGKRGIVGDADPRVAEVAGQFTPTPGGVGPVTVAILWRNAIAALERQIRDRR